MTAGLRSARKVFQNLSWKNRLVTASLLSGALLLGACSAVPDDQAFKRAVRPIMSHAANLGTFIEITLAAGRDGMADTLVSAFRAEVRRLPAAKGNRLRYLSLRLSTLGEAASQWVVASEQYFSTRDSVAFVHFQQARPQYDEACRKVAAAEEVALGTHVVWNRIRAHLIGGIKEGDAFKTTVDSLWQAWQDSALLDAKALR